MVGGMVQSGGGGERMDTISNFCQDQHGWINTLEDLMGSSTSNLKITLYRTDAPDSETGYVVDVLIERGDDVRDLEYVADIIGAESFNDAMLEATNDALAASRGQ